MDGKHQRSTPRGNEYVHEVDPADKANKANKATNANKANEKPAEGAGRGSSSDGLLDEVVRRTLWSRDDPGQFAQAEKDALVATARRLREQGADQTGVANELTRTLLAVRFPQLAANPAQLDEVSRQVAAELLDAPVALQRLERLWRLLLDVDQRK